MVDPKKIDAQIADAEGRAHEISARISRIEEIVKSYAGKENYQARAYSYLAERDQLLTKLMPIVTEIRELNAQYTGWTRAFLVVNSNGHIHKNRTCGTCFPTTKYYWLTELSGDTELEIVALAGERACTVCYPDAPSEYLARATQLEHPDTVRARAEREAKKAEREAKRLKTGIWNADGSELRVYECTWDKRKSEIKTERTAVQIAVEHNLWLSDEYERNAEEVARVTESLNAIYEALAVKHGTDANTEREAIELKALQKQIKQAKATAKWLANNPQ